MNTTTWLDKITDLQGLGWSLARIGAEIGLSVPGVSDIKQGRTTEPRGMAAVKLYQLHRRVMSRAGQRRPARKRASA